MGCSFAGLSSIIFGCIAVLLATLAFALPLWTINGSNSAFSLQNFGLDGTLTFGAGVWGICRDIKLASSIQDLDVKSSECYMYYTNSRIRDLSLNVNNETNEYVEKDASFCDDTVVNTILTYFPIPLKNFRERTCGGLGKTTLSFSILAMIIGIFMVIFLILGITCCKKSSWMVVIGGHLALVSGCCAILSFVLWVFQEQNLGTNIKFGASFYLAIFAALSYMITYALAFVHVKKGRREEALEEEGNYQRASDPPVPPSNFQSSQGPRGVAPNTLV